MASVPKARVAAAGTVVAWYLAYISYRVYMGGSPLAFWEVGLLGIIVAGSGVVLLGNGAMKDGANLFQKVRGGDGGGSR